MREDLLSLINRIEDIQKEFSMSGTNGMLKVNTIYNKDKFIEWKQELRFELQEIYDNSRDKFIWSVLVLLKQKFNGWSDGSSFKELVGSLKAVEKNIDKYYPNSDLKTSKEYSTQDLLDLVTQYIDVNSGKRKPINLHKIRKSLPIRLKPNELQFLLNTLIGSNIIRKTKGPSVKGIDGKSTTTYYYEINKVIEGEKPMIKKPLLKQPKIFISHSSSDVDIVSYLVELFEYIGLGRDQLFCSSVVGYGIPMDEDIYDYLKKQFDEFDLHVIYLLSDNYYSSPACMNEMGAAWGLENKNTMILAPGFEFHKIKGAVNPRQIGLKLDSSIDEVKEKLGNLRNVLVSEFDLNNVPNIRWELKRDDFIKRISSLTISSSSKSSKAEEIKISKLGLIVLNNMGLDASGTLIKTRTFSGTTLQANGTNMIMSKERREVAKWEKAVDELLQLDFIIPVGCKGELFEMTVKGYEYLDSIKKDEK